MGFLSDNKPHTAITETIERLTSERYDEEDLSEIVDLMELITLRPAVGPTEAARALRKKLKYGNKHKQLRALTLLDVMVQNGNRDLEMLYNDDMLLERLRQCALESITDPVVKRKIQTLAVVWAQECKDKRGMERLATFYKHLPALKKRSSNRGGDSEGSGSTSRARGNSFSSQSAPKSTQRRRSATMSSVSKRSNGSGSRSRPERTSGSGGGPFNLERDRPKMLQTIAEANTAATNLQNALQLVNQQTELSTENKQATRCFNQCKKLRRQILKYIQVVESEEYIGSLIHANEELVRGLKKYEKMSKAIGEESDSEEDWGVNDRMRRMKVASDASDSESDDYSEEQEEEEENDPNNPFADSHRIVGTPVYEKPIF
ncbi:LAS seventeen-binding protein 5 [Trichomonascus vanleenenianus]|uniref:Lsb5p n=1 Tax=Trichomonascus vanleenenianus TaxID=2268995 RepID=UPI003ECB5EA8